MRKAADEKNARISSPHFCIEIDEDEEEVVHSESNTTLISSDAKNKKDSTTDDGEKKIDPQDSTSTLNEHSNLLDLSENDEKMNPVIIKLPILDLNSDASLTPYQDKRREELSITKFIFPSTDCTSAVTKVARKFLQVPQRRDDRYRLYDISGPFNHSKIKLAAKPSFSSPDFLAIPEVAKINGSSEDSQNLEEICKESDVAESPVKNSASTWRRPSITNAAIGASIATSLVGVSGGVPRTILSSDITGELLGRSGTPSSISISSTNPSDDAGLEDSTSRFIGREGRRKSRLPFLKLHMPQPHSWANVTAAEEVEDSEQSGHHNRHHHHHHSSLGAHFPHIHVPSFTFTGVGNDGTGRKFSFGIRRHSQMVSVRIKETASAFVPDFFF